MLELTGDTTVNTLETIYRLTYARTIIRGALNHMRDGKEFEALVMLREADAELAKEAVRMCEKELAK